MSVIAGKKAVIADSDPQSMTPNSWTPDRVRHDRLLYDNLYIALAGRYCGLIFSLNPPPHHDYLSYRPRCGLPKVPPIQNLPSQICAG